MFSLSPQQNPTNSGGLKRLKTCRYATFSLRHSVMIRSKDHRLCNDSILPTFAFLSVISMISICHSALLCYMCSSLLWEDLRSLKTSLFSRAMQSCLLRATRRRCSPRAGKRETHAQPLTRRSADSESPSWARTASYGDKKKRVDCSKVKQNKLVHKGLVLLSSAVAVLTHCPLVVGTKDSEVTDK